MLYNAVISQKEGTPLIFLELHLVLQYNGGAKFPGEVIQVKGGTCNPRIIGTGVPHILGLLEGGCHIS